MRAKYFLVDDDLYYPNRWFLRGPVDDDGEELDERIFTYGHVEQVRAWMTIPLRRPGVPMDFTFADSDMPVVRKHVADLLERIAPSDIQRFPVTVESQNDEFEILNVIRLVDCLDAERSDSVMWWKPEDGRPDKTGKPRQIIGLRIDPGRVRDEQIFRLSNWRIALICSEDIKRILEENHITGICFEEV